ncbi:MAG: replication factor C large subunit [Thermoplasmata archaeon]|jgi:replication factor C large subunit|nr:replication factor C large subunit [Thermoplasmata archaeon]
MQEEWTEKHRPKSLADIVGNDQAIRTLRRWADSWASGAPRYKAIVLRGEPGTGKTSASLALARDLGWDVVEMNASDHRNADSIRRVAMMGAISQTFSPTGEFLSSSKGKRKLIILDEADNLFGREDFGGAKAIVETIKESGQPIILIVNDFYELTRKASALKTLADKATFYRLDRRSVTMLLKKVCQKEGVSVDEAAIDSVAQNAGGDLRAAVNDLQMLVEGRSSVSTRDTGALGKRNQEKELATSLRAMFGSGTVKAAREATMDVDLTPDELEKWVEEGIAREFRTPEELAAAFDSLSRSDIYLGRTRKLQHYRLWAYAKDMMTGGVALSRGRAPRPHVDDYGFPQQFIVLSRAKGQRTARDSLCRKLGAVLHASPRRVAESTLPYLSEIARKDRDFLVRLAVGAGLDEGDIGYLLGVDPDSREVSEAASKVKAARGGDQGDRPTKGGGRGKRSLADF